MLIQNNNSLLCGMRAFNKSGEVTFSTGSSIDDEYFRDNPNWEPVTFELAVGERIIGIRSHDSGDGYANHLNV